MTISSLQRLPKLKDEPGLNSMDAPTIKFMYMRAAHFSHTLNEINKEQENKIFDDSQKEKLRIIFADFEQAWDTYNVKNRNFPNYRIVVSWLCQIQGYSYSFSLKSIPKMVQYDNLWKDLQSFMV